MMASVQLRQRLSAFAIGCAAVLAFLVVGNSCFAGTLATTPLAFNDGNGPDGGIWRGSVSIANGPVLGDEVDATVEYAVFPPGRFGQYLTDNGLGGADPSPATAIYAYQVTSVTSATPGLGSLSVGYDPGDLANLVSEVTTGVAGEVSPTASANQLTSAFWTFGTPLGAGDVSSILVIASPSEPELDSLQLKSGLAGGTDLVASISDTAGMFNEVPEPQSVLICSLLLASGLAFRTKK